MADWLTEEREAELIDMWQSRPVLYEVISKGYSNRNMRMVALTEIADTSRIAPRARCMFIISYTMTLGSLCTKTFVV